MSEIKSTLDLIMERTRGLTLSEEDKREINRKNMEDKVSGLVQRYLDGTLLPSELDQEIAAEIEKDSDLMKEILRTEISGRLDPDENNDRLLEILEKYTSVKRDLFTAKLNDFRRRASGEQERIGALCKARLEDKGIMGNAIICNVYKDQEWKNWHTQAIDELHRELSLIRDA